MIPTNGSSFGRAGGPAPPVPGRYRETPASSPPSVDPIPNRRAASRRLRPSIRTAVADPSSIAPRFISSALCTRSHESYLPRHFCSGAARLFRPLHEGFCLRRLHCNMSFRIMLRGNHVHEKDRVLKVVGILRT